MLGVILPALSKASDLKAQLIQLEERKTWTSKQKQVDCIFRLTGPWEVSAFQPAQDEKWQHKGKVTCRQHSDGNLLCWLQCVLLWPLGCCHFVFTVWHGTWAQLRPEREQEEERSCLTFLCFPENQDYSSYLMMQKQSNMTFEATILDSGTPACTLNIHQHLHGLLISTVTWLQNQDKCLGIVNIISM